MADNINTPVITRSEYFDGNEWVAQYIVTDVLETEFKAIIRVKDLGIDLFVKQIREGTMERNILFNNDGRQMFDLVSYTAEYVDTYTVPLDAICNFIEKAMINRPIHKMEFIITDHPE